MPARRTTRATDASIRILKATAVRGAGGARGNRSAACARPSTSARVRSSLRAKAVRAITGMLFLSSAASVRMRRMRTWPSSSGITMSETTTWGATVAAARTSIPDISRKIGDELTARRPARRPTTRTRRPSSPTGGAIASACGFVAGTGETPRVVETRGLMGGRTVNVAPWPGPGLRASMEPPCNSTMCFAIESPMPSPPCARVYRPRTAGSSRT